MKSINLLSLAIVALSLPLNIAIADDNIKAEKEVIIFDNYGLSEADFINLSGRQLYNKAGGAAKFEIFKANALKGDAPSANLTAIGYLTGDGVRKNHNEAAKFMKKSADLGNSFGLVNYGLFLLTGIGIDKNLEESVAWFQKAAALGNPIGMNNLGIAYSLGKGIKKDDILANQNFFKAAELNYPPAIRNYGLRLFNGEGIEKNQSEAAIWFQKGILIQDSENMRLYAILLEEGIGVNKDEAKAFELYEASAKLGNTRAMLRLGMAYRCGLNGINDEKLAKFWFEKAKEGDRNTKIEAINQLGKNIPKNKILTRKDCYSDPIKLD